MKDNPSAFKHSISPQLVKKIGQAIKQAWTAFDEKNFNEVSKKLPSLELKPRVLVIRDAIRESLPQDYKRALSILLQAVKSSDLKGFDLWPVTEFVQTYGLQSFKESLAALYFLTERFTSEFAIRPFLIDQPKETYATLKRWSTDPNPHIRRWTSEGTRPRLPWGVKLKAAINDPKPGLQILENLKFDEELNVRKSVANHLNDIAKDHPDLVITTLKAWQKNCPAIHKKKIDWIQKQALRTLIKKGYNPALKLMGYGHEAQIKIGKLKLNKKIFNENEILSFEIALTSLDSKSQKIAIDYVIHYQKANKKLSPKVFKLKVLDLKPQEMIQIKKNHNLKTVTTRKHYPGLHKIEIQINGKILASVPWQLRLNNGVANLR